MPALVDDDELDAANGAILTAQTLTNVAGAALGGALVGLTSANDVLLLNAVTFVLSGGAAPGLQPRSARRAAGARRRAPDRQPRLAARAAGVGARRCLNTPMLRMVTFSLPVASIALGIVIAASIPTLRDTYAPRTCKSAGSSRSTRSASRSARASPRATPATSTRLGLLALGWGGFGIAPDLWVAGPLSVVGGIGNGIVIVRFRTMMQRETPPHERASTIGFAYAVTLQHDRRRPDRGRAAREPAR